MSQTNIYEAPKADLSIEKGNDEFHEILVIAKRQKALLYTFLIYLLISGATGVVSADVKPLLQLTALPIIISVVIFTARLCLKLYDKASAIFMIVLSIIPLVNLIILLIANSKATKLIKSKGFRVGLVGANIKEITNAI
jgi:hypothetical protein